MKDEVKAAAGRPRRGRPPSAAARAAILQAARDMLAEGGPAAITMEGLAARAGVGKPTIYRWWPDRHAVAMAALMEAPDVDERPRRARSALQELRQQLKDIVARFATPTGRYVAQIIAASDIDSELSKAFRNHVVMARRAEGAALLHRAFDAGDVTTRMNVDVMVDLLYGAIFFRLLMGHAPLDEKFVDATFDHVLRGFKR